MVKIPEYESRESLQPTMMDPRVAAQVGETVVDVSKGLEGLADSIQKMNNKRQTFKSEAELSKGHNELWKFVATSPNLDSLEEDVDRMSQQQIQDASKSITDPETRNNFIEKATIDTDRRNIGLYHTIAQRQSKDYKNSMVQANDEDIKQIHLMADPKEQAHVRQQIVDRVNKFKEDGHGDSLWADHYLKTTLEDIDVQQVTHDINLDGKNTLSELEKGKDGRYNYLSEEESASFQKQAKQKIDRDIREEKQKVKNIWSKNDQMLNQKRMTGSLTMQDVEEQIVTGGISPAMGKSYMKNLRSPDVIGANTDPETYSNLISYVSDPNISNEKKAIALRDANSDGLLSGDDEKDLYNYHLMVNQGKQESLRDVVGEREYKSATDMTVGKFASNIGDYFKRMLPYSKESQAAAAKIFVQSLKKDMPADARPGLTYAAVKKQRVLDRPEMLSYPEQGQQLMDDEGHTDTAYSDGSMDSDSQTQETGAELPSGY